MARVIVEEEEAGKRPLRVPPPTPPSAPPPILPPIPGTDGEFLTSQAKAPAWTTLSGGDVDGLAAALTVRKLLGRPLDTTIPADGDALVWSAGLGRWVPGAVVGTETLAQAYAVGAGPSDSTIALDSTRSALLIKDAATPISGGVLFGVTDDGASKTYFQVSTAGLNTFGPFGFGGARGNSWLFAENSSAATSGAPVQVSPELLLSGRAWNGTVSKEVDGSLYASASSTGGASFAAELRLAVGRDGSFSDALVLGKTGLAVTVSFPGGSAGADASNQHTFPAGTGELLSTDAAQSVTGVKTFSAGTLLAPSIGTDAGNLHALPSGTARLATLDDIDGLDVKASAKVRAATNIASLSGLLTIDGVALVDGDRALLTGQSSASQNGMWTAHSGAWTRPADFATGSGVGGSFAFVEEGSLYASTGWVCISAAPNDVVDTNDLTYAQFSGAGTYAAGNGLTLTGSSFSINTAVTVDKTTAQELTTKTLTAPVMKDGLTASGSAAYDLSGSSGSWRPPTGGLNDKLEILSTSAAVSTSGNAALRVNGNRLQVSENGGAYVNVGAATGSEQTINAASTITIDPASGTTARVALSATAITTINAGSGSAGSYLIVEIIQDGTGGRAITGWSSSWYLKNGAYYPTQAANARDLFLFAWDNTNSIWVEVSRRMNVLLNSVPRGEEYTLSLVDFAVAGASVTAGSGNFVSGNRLYWTKKSLVYGIRFYWAPTTNRSVRVKLWDNSGVAVANATVSTSSSGLYTAYFSSPVTITAYTPYTISMWDTSGTDYSYVNKSQFETSSPPKWPHAVSAVSSYPVKVASHMMLTDYSVFRATDDNAAPSTQATSERYMLEPVYEPG